MKNRQLILSTCLLFSAVLACKQRPNTSQAKIVGGLEAKSDQFLATVALHNAAGKTFCTGAVIGTKSVLTAQHCLGKKFPLVNGKRPIAAIWPKAYDENVEGVYDLALLIFDTPLDLPSAKISTTPPEKGTPFTVVGFGCSELSNRASGGMKRYGTNSVSAASPDGVVTFYGSNADEPIPGVDVITCSGDSGGPLFVKDEVMGVTSGGDSRVHVATGMYTSTARKLIGTAQKMGAGIPNYSGPVVSDAERLEMVIQTTEQ